MAPTEENILSTWLLVPASLQSIMTLGAFTRLFPSSQANNPQIRRLYRDLQHQRSALIDAIERNIEAEAARGNAQKRSVIKIRRAPKEEQDDEVNIEYALYGSTSNLPTAKPHTLSSILPDLESAEQDMEAEIQRLDEESQEVFQEIEAVVGSMSDLRYGKLAKSDLGDAVLEGLKVLRASCDR